MSRTDKTKPFWVKLAHGDLKPSKFTITLTAAAICRARGREPRSPYGTTPCRRRFVYTRH